MRAAAPFVRMGNFLSLSSGREGGGVTPSLDAPLPTRDSFDDAGEGVPHGPGVPAARRVRADARRPLHRELRLVLLVVRDATQRRAPSSDVLLRLLLMAPPADVIPYSASPDGATC